MLIINKFQNERNTRLFKKNNYDYARYYFFFLLAFKVSMLQRS